MTVKISGRLFLCDYSRLNAVKKPVSFLLPADHQIAAKTIFKSKIAYICCLQNLSRDWLCSSAGSDIFQEINCVYSLLFLHKIAA